MDDRARYPHLMERCLLLARRGERRVWPNPMVGCVIVDGDRVVAEGFHAGLGQPHAEVDALRHLGGQADGHTLCVNLEPCCHFGRTPPCTDAILRARVGRVVVGMLDPNPIVNGKGIERLRQAGIEVIVGVEEAACTALNQAFIAWARQAPVEGRRPSS